MQKIHKRNNGWSFPGSLYAREEPFDRLTCACRLCICHWENKLFCQRRGRGAKRKQFSYLDTDNKFCLDVLEYLRHSYMTHALWEISRQATEDLREYPKTLKCLWTPMFRWVNPTLTVKWSSGRRAERHLRWKNKPYRRQPEYTHNSLC